jgi:hypothetical protein
VVGECILLSNRFIPLCGRPAVVGGLSGVIPIAAGVAERGNPLRKFDVLEDANRLVLGVLGASKSGLVRFLLRRLADEWICRSGGTPVILGVYPIRAGDSALGVEISSLESVFCRGIVDSPPLAAVGDSGLPSFIVRGASVSISWPWDVPGLGEAGS